MILTTTLSDIKILHVISIIIKNFSPKDYKMLAQAELLIIDEAAAIPLPLVRNMLGPYLVFISSTVNGYEGTGRSLSLKLLDSLRKQSATAGYEKILTIFYLK